MSPRSDRPWPERADTVDHPATLTILGVDRGDAGLPDTLPDAVPDDADVIISDRPRDRPTRARRWRTYAMNPALALLGIGSAIGLLSVYLNYGSTSRSYDRRSIEQIAASRDLPVESLGRSPLVAATAVSTNWHIAGWVVTAVLVVAALYGVLAPGIGGLIFGIAALGLASAYVLAYNGATLDDETARLFEALRDCAVDKRYEHPVAVVRRRHVPSLADHAKEARIRTSEWTVSPTSEDR